MSTSKPISPDEDFVLMAFSVEPSHGRETLERYIRDYPQYTTALIDFSIDLVNEPPVEDVYPIEVPDSAVDKAWHRFEQATQELEAKAANPFAQLSTSSLKSVARNLNVSNLFLIRVRDRAITFATLPTRFIGQLASELGSTAQAVGAYLQAAPTVTSGYAFRSSMKSKIADQISFQQALETSQLTPEQKTMLKALLD